MKKTVARNFHPYTACKNRLSSRSSTHTAWCMVQGTIREMQTSDLSTIIAMFHNQRAIF